MLARLALLSAFVASAAAIHPARQAQIDVVRASGALWTPTTSSRFSESAPGASAKMCGVKGSHKLDIALQLSAGTVERFVYNSTMDIPDSFDSAKNWASTCGKILGDIRDQSNCGCCWAFGGAEAASDRMCIATKGKLQMPLSAQDVCFNSNFDGCDGGQISTPWSYIKSKGVVTGGQYKGSGPFGAGYCSDFSLPHCHHHGPQGSDPYPAEGKPGCESQSSPDGPKKCDSAATGSHSNFADDKYSFDGKIQSASGEKAIQQAIMLGGPMETAFTVYSDFEDYDGGIYHHVTGSMAGGHAVKFVGWGVDGGVKYWKVANSWNPYWGEKGYFRIKRGNNEGGIEDEAIGAAHDATWAKKSDLEFMKAARA